MAKRGGRFSTIFLVVSVLIMISTVLLAYFTQFNSVFGFRPIIVTSSSMEPEYRVNSLALIQKSSYDDIERGDVITFNLSSGTGQSRDTMVMHRVYDVAGDGLVTKGDAMEQPDGAVVVEDNLIGKVVWHTNFLIDYYNSLRTPGGAIKYAVLPLAGLALLAVAVKLLPGLRRWINERT